MDVRPDSTVSYTVKELLDEQTNLLRTIDRKVDQKADKADVVALAGRIGDIERRHGERIDHLEDYRADQTVRDRFRRRAWTVVGSVSGVASVIVAAFITSGHL